MKYYSAIKKNKWIRKLWYIYPMKYYSVIKKNKWIRKLWYIYPMKYYSAIKKNTFESILMRWVKLERIVQSELRETKRNTIQYINAYIWNLER